MVKIENKFLFGDTMSKLWVCEQIEYVDVNYSRGEYKECISMIDTMISNLEYLRKKITIKTTTDSI